MVAVNALGFWAPQEVNQTRLVVSTATKAIEENFHLGFQTLSSMLALQLRYALRRWENFARRKQFEERQSKVVHALRRSEMEREKWMDGNGFTKTMASTETCSFSNHFIYYCCIIGLVVVAAAAVVAWLLMLLLLCYRCCIVALAVTTGAVVADGAVLLVVCWWLFIALVFGYCWLLLLLLLPCCRCCRGGGGPCCQCSCYFCSTAPPPEMLLPQRHLVSAAEEMSRQN